MRRLLSVASLGFSLAYAIPLTAFVLLRWMPPSPPWWLDLANTFTLYLFIPTLPALLLGLLSLSRSTLLVCLLPIVLFVYIYGGLFIPKNSNSTGIGITFIVMTHNVDAANQNPGEAARAIAETAADIIAIQELTAETAEAMTSALAEKYRYRVLVPREDYNGAGVFSRFPVVSEESFGAGHIGQHLVLDINGQATHLFNVHPFPPEFRFGRRTDFPPYLIREFDTAIQTEQVETVMRKVDDADGPVLLVGDFNITDQTRQYSRMAKKLTDAYREVGWGLGHTFPSGGTDLRLPLPIFRIDYVFHSRELVALEAYVGNNRTGSDHLPIVAKLAFPGSASR